MEPKVPRVYCLRLRAATRQVKINFAAPKKHDTRSFARDARELSPRMTIQDVADQLLVSWDTIKEIQAQHLRQRFGKPKLHKLKQIAIDEISIGKGHRYLTVVLNLLTGSAVFVGDGKGGDALKPFWQRLRRSHAQDRGRRYRHVTRLHPRCVRKTSARASMCSGSLPCDQVVQRETQCFPPAVVSPTDRRGPETAQGHPLAAP